MRRDEFIREAKRLTEIATELSNARYLADPGNYDSVDYTFKGMFTETGIALPFLQRDPYEDDYTLGYVEITWADMDMHAILIPEYKKVRETREEQESVRAMEQKRKMFERLKKELGET